MLWLLLTCCLLLAYTVLLLLYRYWWSKTKNTTATKEFAASTRFSIIIPARNEEKNIAACLQSIAQLNYPNELFEVIVMDDFST
ncbi:MAG: glycosyltransferase, partial [Lacibacter sp.]